MRCIAVISWLSRFHSVEVIAQLYIINPKKSSKYMPVSKVIYEKISLLSISMEMFTNDMICLHFNDDF